MNKSYFNLTLFIHSSVVGHLGCFLTLIVVNDAAMSIRHGSFQISVCFFFFFFFLFGSVSRSRIAWSYSSSIFSYYFFWWGGSLLFSTVAAPIYSQRVSEGSLPPHPSHICYLHSFDGKHFDRSDVISHLNFPDD